MTGAVGQALSVPTSNPKTSGSKNSASEGDPVAFSDTIRDVFSRQEEKGQKQQTSAESEQAAEEGIELKLTLPKRDGASGENRVMNFFLHLSSETARYTLASAGMETARADGTFSLAAERVADVIGRRIDDMEHGAPLADGEGTDDLAEDAAPIDERVIEQMLAAQPSAQVVQAAARAAEKAAVTSPGVFAHARLTQAQAELAVAARQSSETRLAAEAGQSGGGEADDLFRFARAGGDETLLPGKLTEGRVREMLDPQRTPTQAEGAVLARQTAADRPQATLDMPMIDKQALAGVDIVESRKYLGVATGQTAVASVMSAVTENTEFNAMLRGAAATAATTLNAAKNASTSLKIQLSPPELGTVNATFRMSGGHLTIELKVETMEAYRQLSDDNSGLLKAMRGQGYDVEQVVVHHVTGDRVMATVQAGTAQQAGGQPGQPGGQMTGGSGGSSGQQAQSGQNGNPQQNTGGQGEGERRSHQQHNRSGDIYL